MKEENASNYIRSGRGQESIPEPPPGVENSTGIHKVKLSYGTQASCQAKLGANFLLFLLSVAKKSRLLSKGQVKNRNKRPKVRFTEPQVKIQLEP
jgi:hypothetical protein